MSRAFPDSFLWGASTSAHQVEGNTENDWTAWEQAHADRLAATAEQRLTGGHRFYSGSPDWEAVKELATDPANYVSGEACDHYNQYEQDFDLAADLNHAAHRFSLEWSRIQPGPETFDQDALDHYRDMIAALRDRGIEPVVTLWHFTSPQWFAEQGGWTAPDAVDRFQAYVERAVEALGDTVSYWITVNEPQVYATQTCFGEWPAHGGTGFRPYLRTVHRLTTAHRQAYRVIKDCHPDAQVSIAKSVIDYVPYQHKLTNRLPARAADWWWNDYVLRRIHDELDFIGMNHYSRKVLHRTRVVGQPEQTSDLGWGLYPDAVYDALMQLKRYGKPVMITENGAADAADEHREWYLEQVLRQVRQAIADGCPVEGYLHWSLLDNFEWDKGFWPRFGLVEVDYETQERTPRDSAYRYAEIIEQNGL